MGENTEKRHRRKPEEGGISRVKYRLYVWLFTAAAKLRFGLRTDRSAIRGKKGPFLVLGNHTSWLDFLYFAGCVYPRPLNAVVSADIFCAKSLRGFLEGYGIIPKKQFAVDYNCIKLIKKNLDAGVSVLIFPEGRITIDGTTGYIAPSIGKLIKWLGYPVLRGITSGAYVIRPKWGNVRPGHVRLKMDEILSAEDIKRHTAREIAGIVSEKMRYNDNRAFVERGSRLYGLNFAVGLEKLLYVCPKCGAEFAGVSHRKNFVCGNCGNAVTYGRDARLHPVSEGDVCFEYIDEWYAFQRKKMAAEVEGEDFEISEPVDVRLTDEHGLRFLSAGTGTLTINREGIAYVGTLRGEETSLVFSLRNHPTVAYKIGRSIDVSEDGVIYRFVFERGLHTTKAVLAVEELHNRFCP